SRTSFRAGGRGRSPARSWAAATKASTGLRPQPGSATRGGGGRTGLRNAQWSRGSSGTGSSGALAPWSTQARSTATCRGVSGGPRGAGGQAGEQSGRNQAGGRPGGRLREGGGHGGTLDPTRRAPSGGGRGGLTLPL